MESKVVSDGKLYLGQTQAGEQGSPQTIVFPDIKQNRRIIKTLEPERPPPQKERAPRKPPPDRQPVVDELVKTTRKLKGGESPVQSPAFSLLKASARLAQAAIHDPDDLDTLWEMEKRVQRALRRLETVLY